MKHGGSRALPDVFFEAPDHVAPRMVPGNVFPVRSVAVRACANHRPSSETDQYRTAAAGNIPDQKSPVRARARSEFRFVAPLTLASRFGRTVGRVGEEDVLQYIQSRHRAVRQSQEIHAYTFCRSLALAASAIGIPTFHFGQPLCGE